MGRERDGEDIERGWEENERVGRKERVIRESARVGRDEKMGEMRGWGMMIRRKKC